MFVLLNMQELTPELRSEIEAMVQRGVISGVFFDGDRELKAIEGLEETMAGVNFGTIKHRHRR